MFKIYKIIQSTITALSLPILLTNGILADTYKVIDIRGCVATLNNTKIKVGDIISQDARVKVSKAPGVESWTIKLQSTTSGKIHPLCSASATSDKSNDESDSWVSWFWNSITEQKKCSTRAPENELTDGLSQNLSRTFYLLYPYDENENTDIDFATDLEDGTSLKCEYFFDDKLYRFDIPIHNSRFTITSKYFEEVKCFGERVILRIIVKHQSTNGEMVPITDSMNVILINE